MNQQLNLNRLPMITVTEISYDSSNTLQEKYLNEATTHTILALNDNNLPITIFWAVYKPVSRLILAANSGCNSSYNSSNSFRNALKMTTRDSSNP